LSCAEAGMELLLRSIARNVAAIMELNRRKIGLGVSIHFLT
jgi:hypothetical protein